MSQDKIPLCRTKFAGLLLFLLLAILLMLVEWLRIVGAPFAAFESIRNESLAITLSGTGQSVIAACLVGWFLTLLWLKIQSGNSQRSRLSKRDWCKVLLVLCSVFAFVRYSTGRVDIDSSRRLLLGIDQSTNALVFLMGIVLSQLTELSLKIVGERKFHTRQTALTMMVLLLSLASVTQVEIPHQYMYRGQFRSTGLWINPNTFGLLMSLGTILAIGIAARSHTTGQIKMAIVGSSIVAAGLMGAGLVRSYSRGAWIGFVCALFYMAHHWIRSERILHSKGIASLRRNGAVSLVLLCALTLLLFWQFRDSRHSVMRRIFSAANVNDFSWRNRLTTYEGTLQMIADQPLTGFGWNMAESTYDDHYRPVNVENGMAILVNDFFMLGTTCGLPALIGFVACVGFAFSCRCRIPAGVSHEIPPPKDGYNGDVRMLWAQVICRAGVIVLAVGFFFDGGLFKFALAVPFWILLELGAKKTNL